MQLAPAEEHTAGDMPPTPRCEADCVPQKALLVWRTVMQLPPDHPCAMTDAALKFLVNATGLRLEAEGNSATWFRLQQRSAKESAKHAAVGASCCFVLFFINTICADAQLAEIRPRCPLVLPELDISAEILAAATKNGMVADHFVDSGLHISCFGTFLLNACSAIMVFEHEP